MAPIMSRPTSSNTPSDQSASNIPPTSMVRDVGGMTATASDGPVEAAGTCEVGGAWGSRWMAFVVRNGAAGGSTRTGRGDQTDNQGTTSAAKRATSQTR